MCLERANLGTLSMLFCTMFVFYVLSPESVQVMPSPLNPSAHSHLYERVCWSKIHSAFSSQLFTSLQPNSADTCQSFAKVIQRSQSNRGRPQVTCQPSSTNRLDVYRCQTHVNWGQKQVTCWPKLTTDYIPTKVENTSLNNSSIFYFSFCIAYYLSYIFISHTATAQIRSLRY